MKQSFTWKWVLWVTLIISSLSCSIFQGLAGKPTQTGPLNPVNTLAPAATQPAPADQATAAPKPTEKPTSSAPKPNAFFEGISFYYDPSLAKSVQAEVLPATDPASDNMPAFEVNPRIVDFKFNDFVVSTDSQTPRVMVFSVEEYQKLDSENVDKEVSALKKLLEVKPSVSSGTIPVLPIWNAAQVIRTNLKYVSFQNGEGVRFVTQYGQDISPITNERIFYIFQGLTRDGKFYISAEFPVNNPALPANYDSAMKDTNIETLAKNYQKYVSSTQDQMNGFKDDSYTPSLTLLDAMIQSIKIDK